MLNQETLLHDRYLITETIAEGGSRTVYLAEDRQLASAVILQRYDFNDAEARQGFENRARALAEVRHAALAQVIDSFTDGDSFFVVTERIEGDSLAKTIEGRGEPYTSEEVERWTGQLLDAITLLHSEETPIIHGQIAPENLTLTADNQIVLASPIDIENQSVAFASPEQFEGNNADARSDLYSLGASAYYLATATAPPDAGRRIEAEASEQIDPLRRANKINPQISSTLADAINKAMALDPDERFASASEMRSALSGEDQPAVARAQKYDTAPAAAGRKTGQRPWLIAAIGVLLIAAVGIGLFAWQRNESKDPTSLKNIKLSARDMQLLFQEILQPDEQAAIAKDPKQKQNLVKGVKELLAIAQQAESEGYAERPELQSQLSMNTDDILLTSYMEKNPQAKATDEEINAYHQAHPTAFDDFVKTDPRLQMQIEGPQGEQAKNEFKKKYGEIKVLADRARTEKMDRDDLTRLKLLVARGRVLAQAYFRDFQTKLAEEIKPEDVQQYYNEHQSGLYEVRARHILISTEDGAVEEKRQKAEEILARIRGGEDFAKLAAEFSDDQASKVQGGDLGFQFKGSLVPEFENVMFALNPGELSDVVETDYGFHIIKVEERKPTPSPESDEKVRQQILKLMKQERIKSRMKEIVDSSNIDIAENFDATPKPMPMPPQGMPGRPPQGLPNQ